MKLTLTVHQQFEATHSLEGNETPHPHVWSVELRFETRANVETGEGLVKGKLVDIPSVQKGFDAIVAPLRGTYLNDSEFVDSWVRATPTCETLAHYFYRRMQKEVVPALQSRYPGVVLSSVRVLLADPGHPPMGSARIEVLESPA